jgi:hypothetical protein
MFLQDISAFNDPQMQQLDLASVTGITNAQNFAKIFALAMDGTLISNSTLHQLSTPTLNYWHIEEVVLYPLVKGYGFFYDKHPNKIVCCNQDKLIFIDVLL